MNPARRPAIAASSLLDRLIDDAPADRDEPRPARDHLARPSRESLRRDLEFLLGTRQRLLRPPAGAEQLARSVVDFGLPATRGADFTSPQLCEAFRSGVEAAIRRFEPRLGDVRVSLLPPAGPSGPLRLAIDATTTGLAGDLPASEFLASIDPRSGRIEVREGGS